MRFLLNCFGGRKGFLTLLYRRLLYNFMSTGWISAVWVVYCLVGNDTDFQEQ